MITEYPALTLPVGVIPQPTPVYSIFGWFADNTHGGAAVPFSGHLRLIASDGSFEGVLGDIHGESKIVGKMTKNKLWFEKKYQRHCYDREQQQQRESDYSYLFKPAIGNEWAGQWTEGRLSTTLVNLVESDLPIRTACTIVLVCEDASLMVWDR